MDTNPDGGSDAIWLRDAYEKPEQAARLFLQKTDGLPGMTN